MYSLHYPSITTTKSTLKRTSPPLKNKPRRTLKTRPPNYHHPPQPPPITYLYQQRPHPFPVSRDAAHVAAVVVGVVHPPVGRRGGHPLRLVPPPLADQAVVAEGADQRRAVVPKLLGVRRADVL